jgi:hypothetical protein
MRPEDVELVERSWALLRCIEGPMLRGLARRFADVSPSPAAAVVRARWMFDATEALVGLLAVPSRLSDRAGALGATWPDPLTAPSFAVDGRAWLATARECVPTWSDRTEDAWRQGWLLLSEVLAAEALAPFQTVEPSADERGGS